MTLLVRARLAESWGIRAARLYGIGIGLSYTLTILLLPDRAPVATVNAVVKNALVSASWAVAGLVMVSAARNLQRNDRNDGISALIGARGYHERDLGLARLIAAASVITVWIFVPVALLSVLAGTALSTGALRFSLGWVGFALVYAALLGASVSALARCSARFFPEHGPSVLIAAVLVPHLLRLSFPDLPSFPAAFAWLLERGSSTLEGFG
jgi:hypothetical protein